MAHFAKLSDENVVLAVLTVSDEDCRDENNVEQESVGIQFLAELTGWPHWKKTSYNTKGGKHYDADGNESTDQTQAFRKNYAGIGSTYDAVRDAFISPKIHTSWVLNENTCRWEPPIPYPSVTTISITNEQNVAENVELEYGWNEESMTFQGTHNEDTYRWNSSSLEWTLI
jgi:hypothetical protein